MQTMRKANGKYWATPIFGVAMGIVYLVVFSIGGRPVDGLIGLGVMLAFSVAIVLAGRRSETVRGLLDHRDERISAIDLRATAITALVMILAVLAGFVIQVARGQSGWPYDMLAAAGGVTYLAAVVVLRLRS
jgi:uncharacterized membrane protein